MLQAWNNDIIGINNYFIIKYFDQSMYEKYVYGFDILYDYRHLLLVWTEDLSNVFQLCRYCNDKITSKTISKNYPIRIYQTLQNTKQMPIMGI